MISTDELKKLNVAEVKSKRLLLKLTTIPLSLVGFFGYFMVKFYYESDFIGILYCLSGIFIVSFFMYRFTSELFSRKNISIIAEGIKLPYSKRKVQILGKERIIRYSWIELVILNDVGGGLYVDIFFTKDGKKYLSRCFQRTIEDYVKFITELRKRGIEVKVLEPSYKYQKKHDLGWIADMMRGREFV